MTKANFLKSLSVVFLNLIFISSLCAQPAKVARGQRDLPGRGVNKTQRDLPGRGVSKTQRDLPGRGVNAVKAEAVAAAAVETQTPAVQTVTEKFLDYNAYVDVQARPYYEEDLSGDDDALMLAKLEQTETAPEAEPEKLKTAEEIAPKTEIEEFAGPAIETEKVKETESVPVESINAEAAPKAQEVKTEKVKSEEPIVEVGKKIEQEGGFFTNFLEKHRDKGDRPAEILVKPERAGFTRYYEEGLGFKVTDFLSVSSRVELFEEPVPVESLIFGLYQSAWYTKPWPETNIHLVDKYNKNDARASVRHAYTRAYAWTGILKINESLPLLRYTYDRRDLLREFDETVNGFKLLMQETHEVFGEYAVPFKIPYVGRVILNPGYQRIRFHGRGNPNASEYRNKYIAHWLFKHNANFETFMGYEFYEGKAVNTTWIMKPQANRFLVEERIWIQKIRLSIIPGYYYNRTNYRPDPAHFILHETFIELNKDWTQKLRMTKRTDLKWGEVEHEPNSWVSWEKDVYQPPRIKAQALKETLKFSYEIIPHVDLSAGINYSTGLKYNNFDNVGGLWEIELFRPGLIRIKFGYFYNLYYNIETHAEGFQFRAFMFQ